MLIRGTRRIVAIFVAAASIAIAATAAAEPPTIYKWVDENGIAHYTTNRDSIPSEIRDRVESRGGAASATATPGVAATGQPHREDLMRDAVRKTPPVAAAGGEPIAAPTAPSAEVSEIAAPGATPVDRALEQEAAVETETAAELEAAAEAEATAEVLPEIGSEEAATLVEVEEPVAVEESVQVEESVEVEAPVAVEEPVEAEPTVTASPTPMSEDVREESSAVSAPPPAPSLVLEPELQAQVVELDQKIAGVQQEIAQREETLAVLISTSDEQRTMPLVDDPAFREISQVLPKLQADLQTLREQRNKIQPTAPTP